MSRMNNSFDLTGYVGADPEIRFNPNTGNRIVNVSLGVDASYRDRDSGNTVERVEWIDLTVYRDGLGKVFEQYVRKGSEIRVRGFLRKQVWESKDRVDEAGRAKMDSRLQLVVDDLRLGRRPKDGANSSAPQQDLDRANADAAAASSADQDDGIPF